VAVGLNPIRARLSSIHRQRPREQECHFEVENNEENGHQVEPDVEFHPGIVECVESAFIGGQFFRIGLLEGDEEGRDQKRQTDQARDPDKHHKWKIILQDAGHRRCLFPRLLGPQIR
jgi:hypothetical protein